MSVKIVGTTADPASTSDFLDEPPTPVDDSSTTEETTPVADTSTSEKTPPVAKTESESSSRRSKYSFIAVVTLLLLAPPALVFVFETHPAWLLISMMVLAALVAAYIVMKRSVELPADSTIQPSQGVWHSLNRLFAKREGSVRYIYKNDLASQEEVIRLSDEQQDLDDYEAALVEATATEIEGESFTVCYVNVKGGASKTPQAASASNYLGSTYPGLVVYAIDFNPFLGNLANWLGVKVGKRTLRSLNEDIERGIVRTFKQLRKQLGFNLRSGVRAIISDKATKGKGGVATERRTSISAKLVDNVLRACQENADIVICDTHNDIGSAAFARIVAGADVVVVAGICQEDKIYGAAETCANFLAWGSDASDAQMRTFQDRLRHAIVSLTAIPPGETLDDYKGQLSLEELGLDSLNVMGIPYDAELSRFQPVDPAAHDQYTRIAIREQILMFARVAKHTSGPLGWRKEPLVLKQGELVEIPSGRKPVLPYLKAA